MCNAAAAGLVQILLRGEEIKLPEVVPMTGGKEAFFATGIFPFSRRAREAGLSHRKKFPVSWTL